MAKKYNFDYIIIGGGAAGCHAASCLAQAGKSVALVEKSQLGGSNLNLRDIPYLTNSRLAHLVSELTTHHEVGGHSPHYNFPAIASSGRRTVSSMRRTLIESLKKAKVTLIPGYAHLLDPHTVSVGQTPYTAARFILATGSVPTKTGIIGLDTTPHFLPEDAIQLSRLPKSVFIIGGGPTGCETAEYFAKLGTKVTLAEQAPRLIPDKDPECSEAISKYLTEQLGINILTNAKVVQTTRIGRASASITFSQGDRDHLAETTCLVLATGSTPYTDYGLENAGVKYDQTGIKVSPLLETSMRNIFAIGDCIGGKISSTELAEYQASVLATNLLHRAKTSIDYSGFPSIIGTTPSLASVGQSEAELKSKRRRYKKALVRLDSLPTNPILGCPSGFVKIISSPDRHILGASIFAPHADLMIAELSTAIRHHLTALEIASTPHIANSPSYAIKLAAKKLV